MSQKNRAKLVPLPTEVMIPERDLGKKPVLDIQIGRAHV